MSNKAELYVGLIHEALRKDIKYYDCPIAFLDYSVERSARINNRTKIIYFNFMDTMRILN